MEIALGSALLNMLVTAAVPVAADWLRAAGNWLFGGAGAEPTSVKERIELMQAETERVKALALLDAPAGNISPWVANLRAAFRYIAAGVILTPVPFVVIYGIIYPTAIPAVNVYLSEVASPVFGFMWGDRLRVHLRKTS